MPGRGYKTGPATRSTVDSHAFLKEEKFDTWLDLGPLHELQKYCRGADDWTTEVFSPLNCIFSGESLCLLKMTNITPNIVANAKVTPCLPAMIISRGLSSDINRCHLSPSDLLTLYSTATSAAQTSFNFQVAHVMKNLSPEISDMCVSSLAVWDDKLSKFPYELNNFAYIVEDMMLVLEAYKFMSEYRKEKTVRARTRARINRFIRKYGGDGITLPLPSIQAELKISLDLSILRWQTYNFLLTHKYLLEIVNKVNETYCALLYSHMISGTSMNNNHYTCVVKFLLHISGVVSSFCRFSNDPDVLFEENRAFMYLKVMEGLGVASIILREDVVHGWYNDKLIEQLWQSVVDEKLQLRVNFFDSPLCNILNSFDTSSIAEVLGLVKLCGHPSIEIYKGLAKLKERTHANINVDPVAVNRTIGVMKRELIINFRRKRNLYPVVDINLPYIPRALRRLIERNISPDSEEGMKLMSGVTIEHWALVKLGKNDDFDPIDNQLVLLKDKALGMTRSKVLKYILCKEPSSTGAGLGPIEERRALLAFLLSDHFSESFRQYITSYEKDEVWTSIVYDYLVVKLTAKELEEKPEGRMFGASPAEERNRRVVQEENTMRVMDNFFRDQLMTPDELQMLRKLFSFRHFNKMYPHHKLLQVSFDFSKWNNNMRSASIDTPARETLDQWFGTKIFGKTMKAFESSLFYYKDMLRMDHWDGQLGGIEGLNQATWSIIFLCGIKQALEGLGVIYQLTVKGDDVRAALVIPDREYKAQGIKKIRDDILNSLSKLCQAMGWQLNPHECFVSLSVIATSQQYQVNDTFLPAATKKIIKMEALSNLIYPTTEDMIASIFSIAHSTCAQATTILSAFICALFMACRLLKRELWNMGTLNDNDIAVLAMWPQCLGGPGSLPLQTFFVRGENDMLSISVSLLRSIVLADNNGLSRQVRNILAQKVDKSNDLTLLVTDPYSIALNTPERPNAVLKRLMRTHMPAWVKNPDLKVLLTLDTQVARKEFLDHITSMVPYVAKVVTTLWETSPFYIIEEVLSKFMESATIFSFFARGKTGRISTRNAHRALSQVLRAARKRKCYWVHTVKACNFEDPTWLGIDCSKFYNNQICTTQLIHEIREASWGFKIKGITYPSLVDQNLYYTPNDLIQSHPGWGTGNIATSILLEHDRSVYQTTDTSLHYSAAPGLAPWLGAQTASKLELPTISTRITSPAINKILRLINLKVNAHILGADFILTVDLLLRSLTGLPLQQLDELIPESGGGHISHRVSINSFSTSTMPNSRPNLSQIVKLSSDAGAALRGDTTNRTVNFAARHFFSVVIATWPLQSRLTFPLNYPTMLYTLFHYDVDVLPEYKVCPWCCNDVNDGPVTFKNRIRPYLADFRYLSLVGCSEFEEKTLRKNMAEALAGKVRRTAYHELQNVNDPTIIDISVHILIKRLNKERLKIYEAAQGAQFACTPRAELLDIMSVAMGIKSVSTISMNILRLMPSAPLYRAVLSEVFYFCTHWLAVTIDPENMYQLDNMMDYLNPLSGLFDSLIAAQVLHRIKEGAILHGGIHDFKWSAGSITSGGAAMKCFFSYHKQLLMKWIRGEETNYQAQIYTQREDNVTIIEALDNEFRRIVYAALNRANVTFLLFRISSHWRRIMDRLQADQHLLGNILDFFDVDAYDLRLQYDDNVVDIIYTHYLSDTIEGLGVFTLDHISEFWAYTFMCFMIAPLFMKGRWNDFPDEYINSSDPFNLCELDDLDQHDLLPVDPDVIAASQLYEKWSSMFTTSELTYIYNLASLYFPERGERIDNMMRELYNRTAIWLSVINERRLMVMTQDNAELVLKKSHELAQEIIQDHIQQMDDPDPQRCQDYMGERDRLCQLGTLDDHHELLRFTKPLMIPAHLSPPHALRAEYTGLAYTDVPPPELYFMDPTENLRGSGIHNTSVSKYFDIIDKLNLHHLMLDMANDSCVLSLADGLGGVTARFLATYPELHVIYNSMYYNTKTGRRAADAHEAMPPIEVSSLPDDMRALERLHWQGMYPGDLTREDVRLLITNVVKRTKRFPILVTMDADIPWHDDMKTAREVWFGALKVSSAIQNAYTIHVYKCFCIHHPVVYEFCHTIISLYSHVHLYRTSYTRQRSTEFFIIFFDPRDLGTLEVEVNRQYERTTVFSKSLMISDYINGKMDAIGQMYIAFRTLGRSQILDLWTQLQGFIRAQAYPLDLTNSMSALKISHSLDSGCLCTVLQRIKNCVNESLMQARDNVDSLMVQMQHRSARDVQLKIGGRHVISTGWKGIQVNLRKLAKLHIVRDWLSYVLENRGTPVIQWKRVSVDETYSRIYTLLVPWKRIVAPIIVNNTLFVCCERFNDNWTVMFASTIKKCQQMIGSIYLCLGYVHQRHEFVTRALQFLSRNVHTERCCEIHSGTLFAAHQQWETQPLAISLGATPTTLLETFAELPTIDNLIELKLLDRGYRSYPHDSVDVIDPNLVEQVHIIADQPDEELQGVIDEFAT